VYILIFSEIKPHMDVLTVHSNSVITYLISYLFYFGHCSKVGCILYMIDSSCFCSWEYTYRRPFLLLILYSATHKDIQRKTVTY
jgi:hypothetical protein